MKATCQNEIIYQNSETLTEETAYGPFEKKVTIRVTEKHWTNYPGKVTDFKTYAVDTFWNGRLIEGHITSTRPTFAQ